MMNKYLFTTLPSDDLGLLTRSLPIANALRERGHHINFCSPGISPRKLVSEAGFENVYPDLFSYHIMAGGSKADSILRIFRSKHPIRDAGILISLFKHLSTLQTTEIINIDHFMSVFGMWNKALVRANVEALIQLFNTNNPDVIVDFWNPFACIAARVCNIPLITILQADMHPQSEGFIWWKDTEQIKYISPILATNAVLTDYQLPTIHKIGQLFLGDKTLVMGTPEMDPLPETAKATYIGPILWQKDDGKLPDWVNRLNNDRPVVWLYPGNIEYLKGSKTVFDSTTILQACVEALGNEELEVVLTTAFHALPEEFLPLPQNFHHTPYLPGLAMAEKSDMLIHHGGYGSCQTGLYTGKPALILPTFSERESNARRIAAVGAGIYILPNVDEIGRNKEIFAEEIRNAVLNILSDSSYAENAKRIGKQMKGYGGVSESIRQIENFSQTEN